jgi:hypothetical protein
MLRYTLKELSWMALPTDAIDEKVSYREALKQTEDIMRRVYAMRDFTLLDEDDLLDFAECRDMLFDKAGNCIR